MAKWNETPNWTPLEQINGGQEFSNMLSPDDLNALAENIEYLYETAQSGTDTSDATAWAAAILEGETAYVGGEKLTGTMPNKGYTEGDFAATLDADFTELELFGAYNGTVAIDPEEITVTENGTYEATDGKVISKVNVNVAGEVLPDFTDESVGFDLTYNGEADGLEIVYSSSLKSALPIATSGHLGFIPEENLRQENIKDGVTILGITGNYGGETVVTWDGTGVVIAPIEEEPTTFTFTIGDTEYEAEEGMTWYEWVQSDYSPDSYSCESAESNVYPTGDTYIADSEGNAVIGSTLITEGGVYSIEEVATEDALAGTWVFNDTLEAWSSITRFKVNFYCDGVSYIELQRAYSTSAAGNKHYLYYIGDNSLYVYDGSTGWEASVYKTINITSNLADVTNGDSLLSWLQANATKQ